MGEVDIEKERQEMEIRRRLFMANKKLESLDSYQYKVASEFYSQVYSFFSKLFYF